MPELYSLMSLYTYWYEVLEHDEQWFVINYRFNALSYWDKKAYVSLLPTIYCVLFNVNIFLYSKNN